MDSLLLLLTASFFFIALIYASVGFGGGSSYLALLAQPIFLLQQDVIRPTALLCNIVVVLGATLIFYRDKKIIWKEIWPFLLLSIPMAYLGGLMKLTDSSFFILLGITLIVASLLLWFQPSTRESAEFNQVKREPINVLIGGSVGFLSGLVSIGGGIFLSPILHLLKWSHVTKISALASIFILANSLSGLVAQVESLSALQFKFLLPLLLAVFIGGQLGSRLGVRKFNPIVIKRITAALILLAAINILKNHW